MPLYDPSALSLLDGPQQRMEIRTDSTEISSRFSWEGELGSIDVSQNRSSVIRSETVSMDGLLPEIRTQTLEIENSFSIQASMNFESLMPSIESLVTQTESSSISMEAGGFDINYTQLESTSRTESIGLMELGDRYRTITETESSGESFSFANENMSFGWTRSQTNERTMFENMGGGMELPEIDLDLPELPNFAAPMITDFSVSSNVSLNLSLTMPAGIPEFQFASMREQTTVGLTNQQSSSIGLGVALN